TNNVSGNLVGTPQDPIDPKLQPLGNYGGPTPTMAITRGSRAIDAGSNIVVQATTDQRGYSRIVGQFVDNRAFEYRNLHYLVVAPDLGHAPEVKVYDAETGALRLDFNAYEPSFMGGVRVALGDFNLDGVPDIVTAPGGVKVTLVNVNGTLLPAFDTS